MKKVYSKRLGGEVFALAPQQLEIFRQAGYRTPTPEEVIADAGAATLIPPAGKKAYVAMNLRSGEFAIRVRGCTLKGNEPKALIADIVQAGIVMKLAVQADPDGPKPAANTSKVGTILAEARRRSRAEEAVQSEEGAE